jgi:hypothetical protein
LQNINDKDQQLNSMLSVHEISVNKLNMVVIADQQKKILKSIQDIEINTNEFDMLKKVRDRLETANINLHQEIQELNDQGNIIQVQNLQFPFKIMDDGLIQKGID